MSLPPTEIFFCAVSIYSLITTLNYFEHVRGALFSVSFSTLPQERAPKLLMGEIQENFYVVESTEVVSISSSFLRVSTSWASQKKIIPSTLKNAAEF